MEDQFPPDPTLRAFAEMVNSVFDQEVNPRLPHETPEEHKLRLALHDLDLELMSLRDLVAQMRASLAELRHRRKDGFKP